MKLSRNVLVLLVVICCCCILLPVLNVRLINTVGVSTTGTGTLATGGGSNKGTKSKTSKQNHHDAALSSQEAYDFVMSRRDAYDAQGLVKRWKMRGVGYLYHYWNLLLLATLPPEPLRYGRNVVTIRNIMDDEKNEYRYPTSSYIQTNGMPFINCSLWSIYVRVNGPEIFAGTADAVFTGKKPATSTTSTTTTGSACHWEFPFDLNVPGSYLVDVKILYYNASSIMEAPCLIKDGVAENVTNATGTAPFAGFKGFKMYSAAQMCCEICSRLYNDCTYWSTPPLNLIEPTYAGNNGCDLYFRDHTSDWITDSMFVNNTAVLQEKLRGTDREIHVRRQLADFHGPPSEQRPMYFMGCGWSFWMTLDFPCISGELDDRIYIGNSMINNSTFTLLEGKGTTDEIAFNAKMERHRQLPLCTIDTEQPDRHRGRWVRSPWPDQTMCPDEMEKDPNNSDQFVIMKHDPQHPQCYHRDDLSIVGHACIEMNCQFITQESKWMTSSLHLEKLWYGVYEQYDCRYYYDFTDAELQTCVEERKIYKFDGSGHSIWHFMRQYLNHRTSNLTLYDNIADDGLEIHLSSLGLTHEPYVTLRSRLHDLPELDPDRIEFYWVNSLFMSSEREQEARGPVQQMKANVAEDVLGPKNYRMLNLYDMTKAFTYDTATQMDGFHIIGPPMKMIISKLLHYVCSNTSVAP